MLGKRFRAPENLPVDPANTETPPVVDQVSAPGAIVQGADSQSTGSEIKPKTGEGIPPPPPPAQTAPEPDPTGLVDVALPPETAPDSAGSMVSVNSVDKAAQVTKDLNRIRNAENGLEADVSERPA